MRPLTPPQRAALRVVAAVAIFVPLLPLGGCYLLKQGAGQAELLWRREPISTVLADPKLEAGSAERLRLIGLAKAYAEQAIGLRHTTNYEALVRLDRDAVTYVVSAAPKDALKPHLWWFPIIGNVPYKGFFDRNDAVAEQQGLERAGLDTTLRGVAAFSTLGWLPDPVYSPFLKYELPTLANIVIHETTHATLYLAGQAAFNEGFATFVGNQGAQDFFARTKGLASPEYKACVDHVKDNAIFTDFVQEVSAKLDALYTSPKPRAAKLTEREGLFKWAKSRFETSYQPRMHGHGFRHFPNAEFNNANLISYRTYYNRLDRFERAHAKIGGDLRQTVAWFKDTVAKESDPEAFLDRWLVEPKP